MLITEESVYNIIQDTWTSTLGFQVDLHAPDELSATEGFTVCVRIGGAWDGEVRMHCSPRLARIIAAVIFQMDADTVGSFEILDALSELLHIVAGNLKALLPQPVTISLPSLPDLSDWTQATPQWQMVCRLDLMSEGYLFVVTLLGGLSAAARDALPSQAETRMPPANP